MNIEAAAKRAAKQIAFWFGNMPADDPRVSEMAKLMTAEFSSLPSEREQIIGSRAASGARLRFRLTTHQGYRRCYSSAHREGERCQSLESK